MKNKFPDFFLQLDEKKRARLASLAGTTVEYIEHHLLPGRRVPRRKLVLKLVGAAGKLGHSVTPGELLTDFMQAAAGRAK